jgi:hypothetical protein
MRVSTMFRLTAVFWRSESRYWGAGKRHVVKVSGVCPGLRCFTGGSQTALQGFEAKLGDLGEF